jgi:hypothetical protein
MAVQEEPKEPHVSSVLPWIILHRIIWQEEDTFRSLCHQQQLQNPAEEGIVGSRFDGLGLDSHVLAPNLCPRAPRPYPGTVSRFWAQCDRISHGKTKVEASLFLSLGSLMYSGMGDMGDIHIWRIKPINQHKSG